MTDKIMVDADFFEHLLNCLANQKYIGDFNADAIEMGEEAYKSTVKSTQAKIDEAWIKGMEILVEAHDD